MEIPSPVSPFVQRLKELLVATSTETKVCRAFGPCSKFARAMLFTKFGVTMPFLIQGGALWFDSVETNAVLFKFHWDIVVLSMGV